MVRVVADVVRGTSLIWVVSCLVSYSLFPLGWDPLALPNLTEPFTSATLMLLRSVYSTGL